MQISAGPVEAEEPSHRLDGGPGHLQGPSGQIRLGYPSQWGDVALKALRPLASFDGWSSKPRVSHFEDPCTCPRRG